MISRLPAPVDLIVALSLVIGIMVEELVRRRLRPGASSGR